MPKNTYWISDVDGVRAPVEGVDQRDEWTKNRGWQESTEPGPTDQVHIVYPDSSVLPGRVPFAALAAGWSAMGWKAAPPIAYQEPLAAQDPPKSAPATSSTSEKDGK